MKGIIAVLAVLLLASCSSQEGAPGYSAVDNDGVTLARRAILDLSGDGVSCTDAAPRTACIIDNQADGYGRAAGQTAANNSILTYSVGTADESLTVSANVNVTASATHNFAATVSYTDQAGNSITQTETFSQPDGTFITAITEITGAGPYAGVPLHIRAQANSSLTCETSGTFTSVTYSVECVIEKTA